MAFILLENSIMVASETLYISITSGHSHGQFLSSVFVLCKGYIIFAHFIISSKTAHLVLWILIPYSDCIVVVCFFIWFLNGLGYVSKVYFGCYEFSYVVPQRAQPCAGTQSL